MYHAIEQGEPTFAEMLVSKGANVSINEKSEGRSPLLQAVGKGYYNLTVQLLDNGAQVNHKTNGSWTPLMSAAANGDLALTKLLLSRGADQEIQHNSGWLGHFPTATDEAVRNGHWQVAYELWPVFDQYKISNYPCSVANLTYYNDCISDRSFYTYLCHETPPSKCHCVSGASFFQACINEGKDRYVAVKAIYSNQ